jgi:hypothetical protein
MVFDNNIAFILKFRCLVSYTNDLDDVLSEFFYLAIKY